MKDAYRLVRNCVSGFVFDSSPIDITNDLGSRFALHRSILSRPGPSKVISWLAKGVSSTLDALYLTKFESQRAQYWQNLHSSVVSFIWITQSRIFKFFLVLRNSENRLSCGSIWGLLILLYVLKMTVLHHIKLSALLLRVCKVLELMLRLWI